MIEKIEVGRHTERRLAAHQPFGGPAVQRVTGRRQDAFFQMIARIQPQESAGEIAVAVVDGLVVGGFSARRDGWREHAERADFTAIEPRQNRNARLLATIERIHDLVGQDMAVHRAERSETRDRRRHW